MLDQIGLFLKMTLEELEVNDASWNGIQIENNGEIDHIYLGVDSTIDFLKAAEKPRNALFLVHHGLFWKHTDPRTIGVLKEKIYFCFHHNAALVAYHLPLDIHPIYGNNSQLLKKLGFIDSELMPFGYRDGIFYGYHILSNKVLGLKNLLEIAKKEFSEHCILFPFGDNKITSCAVISGSGGFGIQEAYEKKIDLFVTGEYSHSAYTFARDHRMNFLCLTHYGSEKEGVLSLGAEIAKKFSINFTFLDILPIL